MPSQYPSFNDREFDLLKKLVNNTGLIVDNGGGGGGAGNPAGVDGDFQYNNAGVFGGFTPGAGIRTFLTTPTSANLAAALTDETGTGVAVFSTSPTIAAPTLTGTTTAATVNSTTLTATNLTFNGVSVTGPTGTGNMVLATNPTLTLTNATGLPISTGVSGLAANVATFLGTPSSANLAAAITDETGSGALVFGTSPTIAAPTVSGIASFSGTDVTTASAMGALAIDVTKQLNTKSISVDSTFTFSGTPANSNQWFGMYVINSDTNSHVLTIPSSRSITNNATITSLTIPANGELYLMWRYDGSVYKIFGDPTLIGTLIQSSIATGSAVSLTTATPANITSITLTPGTWSVIGSVVYKPSSATSTRQDVSVNSTSATLSTTQGAFKTTFFSTTTASVNFTNEVPEQIITVTSNTTYYLVAQITFSAGTMAGFGDLHATRIK